MNNTVTLLTRLEIDRRMQTRAKQQDFNFHIAMICAIIAVFCAGILVGVSL